MSVSSIRTEYKGHLMRSRLEVRWAMFMDEVGIEWSYEPTYLQFPLANGRTLHWLPDFRLANGQWAEAKGDISIRAYGKLLYMAKVLSAGDSWDEDGCGTGDDVVVLGRMPGQDSGRWPVQLHYHDRDLWAVPWTLTADCPKLTQPVDSDLASRLPLNWLLDGTTSERPGWAYRALSVARQARFR